MALYEKLGGDNEASRMMGRATQSIASHFAAQSQIDAVSAHAHVVYHSAGMFNMMGLAGEGLSACVVNHDVHWPRLAMRSVALHVYADQRSVTYGP